MGDRLYPTNYPDPDYDPSLLAHERPRPPAPAMKRMLRIPWLAVLLAGALVIAWVTAVGAGPADDCQRAGKVWHPFDVGGTCVSPRTTVTPRDSFTGRNSVTPRVIPAPVPGLSGVMGRSSRHCLPSTAPYAPSCSSRWRVLIGPCACSGGGAR